MNISRTNILLLAPLMLVFLCFPQGVQASTDTESAIARLTAQVAVLQKQLALSHGSTTFSVVSLPKATKMVTVSQKYYTSRSSHPTIEGTANINSVYVIMQNTDGVGFAGTLVPVTNGKWSYESIVALAPGYYRVEVSGGEKAISRTIHIIP